MTKEEIEKAAEGYFLHNDEISDKAAVRFALYIQGKAVEECLRIVQKAGAEGFSPSRAILAHFQHEPKE